jgi:hypothetical protein
VTTTLNYLVDTGVFILYFRQESFPRQPYPSQDAMISAKCRMTSMTIMWIGIRTFLWPMRT